MFMGILIAMAVAGILVMLSNLPQERPAGISESDDLRLTIFNAMKGAVRVFGLVLITIAIGGIVGHFVG